MWFFFEGGLILKERKKNMKLVVREVGKIWEELGKGKEYDHNIIFKKFNKTFLK